MAILRDWIETPENRPAFLAVQRVLECLASRRRRREINPLFLHGAAGTGKSYLAGILVREVTGRCPDLSASVLPAGDLALLFRPEDNEPSAARDELGAADLLVIEDLQHLDAPAVEPLVQLLDARLARQRQTVFTASRGPGQLRELPARLTSRLAAGLVVGLLPLSPASRRYYLEERAARKQMRPQPAALAWVADHVPGSVRQLEAALVRLEALGRLHGRPPAAEEVAAAFREDATPTA